MLWWSLAACPRDLPVPAPSEAASARAPGGDGPSAEARSFYLRAAAARARGDTYELKRAAEWVLRLDRGNVWAQLHVSELLLEVDPPGALQAATAAAALEPELPEAQRALGLALRVTGDLEGALPALEAARGLPGAHQAIVDILEERGQIEEARAELSRWTPSSPPEALDWAQAAAELGELQAARARAWPLLSHGAQGPLALRLLLQVERDRCDLGALHRWGQEHAELAADARYRSSLLALARLAGDEALLQRLARLGSVTADDPLEAFTQEASALLVQGSLDDALILAGQSADDVDTWVRRAIVYRLAGQGASEREALQQAQALAPCAPDVLVPLSALLPPCEASALLARAVGVRVADPALASALRRAEQACEGVE